MPYFSDPNFSCYFPIVASLDQMRHQHRGHKFRHADYTQSARLRTKLGTQKSRNAVMPVAAPNVVTVNARVDIDGIHQLVEDATHHPSDRVDYGKTHEAYAFYPGEYLWAFNKGQIIQGQRLWRTSLNGLSLLPAGYPTSDIFTASTVAYGIVGMRGEFHPTEDSVQPGNSTRDTTRQIAGSHTMLNFSHLGFEMLRYVNDIDEWAEVADSTVLRGGQQILATGQRVELYTPLWDVNAQTQRGAPVDWLNPSKHAFWVAYESTLPPSHRRANRLTLRYRLCPDRGPVDVLLKEGLKKMTTAIEDAKAALMYDLTNVDGMFDAGTTTIRETAVMAEIVAAVTSDIAQEAFRRSAAIAAAAAARPQPALDPGFVAAVSPKLTELLATYRTVLMGPPNVPRALSAGQRLQAHGTHHPQGLLRESLTEAIAGHKSFLTKVLKDNLTTDERRAVRTAIEMSRVQSTMLVMTGGEFGRDVRFLLSPH